MYYQCLYKQIVIVSKCILSTFVYSLSVLSSYWVKKCLYFLLFICLFYCIRCLLFCHLPVYSNVCLTRVCSLKGSVPRGTEISNLPSTPSIFSSCFAQFFSTLTLKYSNLFDIIFLNYDGVKWFRHILRFPGLCSDRHRYLLQFAGQTYSWDEHSPAP